MAGRNLATALTFCRGKFDLLRPFCTDRARAAVPKQIGTYLHQALLRQAVSGIGCIPGTLRK